MSPGPKPASAGRGAVADRELDDPVGIVQLEPVTRESCQMGTVGNEDNVVAVLAEAPADSTADRSGPKDHIAHAASFSYLRERSPAVSRITVTGPWLASRRACRHRNDPS